MRVGDIIKVVGGSPLSAFPWGEQVVITINAFHDAHAQIAITDSGELLCERIEALPENVRQYLLNREVVLRLPAPAPAPIPPAPSPVPPPTPVVEPPQDDVNFVPNWRMTIVGLIGLCFILASGNIAFNEHVKLLHAHGVDQHEGYISRIFKAVLDELTKSQDEEDQDKDAQKALSGSSDSGTSKDSHSSPKQP